MFEFFHQKELERVLKGLLTFNSHLLVFRRLEQGEDSVKVSLFYVSFWVQVHDLLMGLFSESMAR